MNGAAPTVEVAGGSAASDSARFLGRAIGVIIAGASLVAFVAALILMIEKLMLLNDPSYVPSCSINPILSCGSIMESDQAEAFGFPNPLLGLFGFGALSVFGAAIALGAKASRRTWLGVQLGVTFAFGLVCWLIFQSLYRIEALCPYCMAVWVAVFTLFTYVTLFNFSAGNIRTPASLRPAVDLSVRFHGVILTGALITVVILIGEAFWDYWKTLP